MVLLNKMWISNWILLFIFGFGYIHAQKYNIYLNGSSDITTAGSQFNITCAFKSISTDLRYLMDMQVIRRNSVMICYYFDAYRRCRRYNDNNLDYFSRYSPAEYTCDCIYKSGEFMILNLTIKEVKKEDNGTWFCGSSYVNKTLPVIVKYPPAIKSIKLVPVGDEIRKGSTVKLSCIVDSFPKSNITWSKNVIQTKHKGPDFIITNSECDDSGKYTCWAENGIGSNASKTQQIDVMCPPRINLIHKPLTLISASLAKSATMNATVMGYPVPTFTWKYILYDKKEKPITDWRITAKSDNLSTSLNVENITDLDFGNYIMYARNTEGEISVVFTLKKDETIQDGAFDTKQNGDNDDNKLGTGIGIGFIVGLLVMGVILGAFILIWKKRGTGINLRQILQYKKRSTTRANVTETTPSARQLSSTRPSTVQPDQTYEGLDLTASEKQTYEELHIYENSGCSKA